MLGELDPTLPSILTGKERVLDAVSLRNALGIGTMGVQNSNSVNISGGNIYVSYINASSSSFSYLYASQIDAQNVTISQSLKTPPVVYTSNSTLGSEIVSLLDGTFNDTCTGTATACSSYSFESCPSALGCVPDGVYCPNYNGDQYNCENNGCTYETTSTPCDSGWDESTCTSYGCSYDEGSNDCTTSWDESTCTSYGCSYSPPTYGNCSSIGDQSTCDYSSGGSCNWDYTYNRCTSSTCSSIGDESTCTSYGYCSWDSMNNSCYGGEYVTTPSDCTGTYPSGSYTCNGNYDSYTGNCVGGGGTCTGTANCSSVSIESCASYGGCSVGGGITNNIPAGNNGVWRLIKNISSNSSDARVQLAGSDYFEDGTQNKVLPNKGDDLFIIFNQISKDCATILSQSPCEEKSCYWDGSSCSGTWYERMWHLFN